ncbi:hypothetical protein BD310DRAFT_930045 [Dichomitus squalens]|uniref:Uncharacterized protein n=1 Tax=Dichomitus squalens TaxID=114155 RepID=A0A4Q9PRU3_9APHY|nr:hypothetical protein BD310DRAFT_930045 [Dichomitus squalens]
MTSPSHRGYIRANERQGPTVSARGRHYPPCPKQPPSGPAAPVMSPCDRAPPSSQVHLMRLLDRITSATCVWWYLM